MVCTELTRDMANAIAARGRIQSRTSSWNWLAIPFLASSPALLTARAGIGASEVPSPNYKAQLPKTEEGST